MLLDYHVLNLLSILILDVWLLIRNKTDHIPFLKVLCYLKSSQYRFSLLRIKKSQSDIFELLFGIFLFDSRYQLLQAWLSQY